MNALFADSGNKEALAEGVNQAKIDAAEKLVKALKDGQAKTNLQTDIAKAKQLLSEKESAENAEQEANAAIEAAVTALKGDSKPTIAEDEKSLTGLVAKLGDSDAEVAIAWKSSDSSKLTDEGTVGTVSQEETVTLTATVSKDKGETKTVNYTVTISSEGKITKIEVAA